eukprot:gene3156-3625_t
MILIGISGGIATGKSTVCNYLKEIGYQVIDADLIARQVVEPLKPAWKDIVQYFGKEILKEQKDGAELDRVKLGDIIFGDEEKRKVLNRITHPRIFEQMIKEILYGAFKGTRILVLDLPLLFERNYHKSGLIHKTIVTSCQKEQQIQRLMQRSGLTESKAMERINSQMAVEEKCRLADIIIDNSKDKCFTRMQVLKLVHVLDTESSMIIWRNRVNAKY